METRRKGIWSNEKDNKKIIRFVLGFVAAIFIIIAAFWGSFVYVSHYKITKADTSVSPDGTYDWFCRLSEKLTSPLDRLPAGWFFMRANLEILADLDIY